MPAAGHGGYQASAGIRRPWRHSPGALQQFQTQTRTQRCGLSPVTHSTQQPFPGQCKNNQKKLMRSFSVPWRCRNSMKKGYAPCLSHEPKHPRSPPSPCTPT